MYAEMLSALAGSFRNISRPAQKMNQMTIAHIEKVLAIQLESAKDYANLGIGHMKAAAEVNDPWSFVGYVAKQGAYATKLGEQAVADVQKIRQLGGDFIEKAQSVVKEEARAIGGAFGEVGKGVAKNAA